VLAAIFIITSVALTVHSSRMSGGSVLEGVPAKTAPAAPVKK
jgi:hypothetical protein